MPALRFQTCRLLSGNVRNKELTIAQRRILRKLRRKKGSIKKKIYPRRNRNNYIQLQTTRKLSLFYGNLPITKMHRRIKRTSYIPFLLNPETRLDVILVRLHFCETLPQARQPISHRKVCVNNGIVNISHFQVSHGDIISFQENYARTLGEEIRRFFYIKILVEKIIGKFLPISPKFGSREERRKRRISKTEYLSRVRMRRISKIEWLRRLKTKKKCLLLLTLQKLHFSMQKADVERGYEITRTNVRVKQFLYSTKYKRMMGDLHRSVILLLREEKKRRMIPLLREGKNFIPTVNLFLREGKKIRIKDLLRSANLFLREGRKIRIKDLLRSANLFLREGRKIRIKRIEQLPTHYSEVNYRTLKAVVFYGPNIDHIPHNIRLKDPNLLQAQ